MPAAKHKQSLKPRNAKSTHTPSKAKYPVWKVWLITTLRKKPVYISLYTVVGATILYLLILPFFPQVQAQGQAITKKYPALTNVAPKSFQPINLDVPTTGDWLIIPKSDIKMPINEGSSIDILNTHIGVWHQTGPLSDNYVLAGHKLQYNRTVNQSLYNLNKLVTGDRAVYIVQDGKTTEYRVTETKIVPPTSIEILNPTYKPQLTIYTCNDFFNQRRFVVTAQPIAVE